MLFLVSYALLRYPRDFLKNISKLSHSHFLWKHLRRYCKRRRKEDNLKGQLLHIKQHLIRYGLVARISGFHPEGPGSIPGIGDSFFLIFFILDILFYVENSKEFIF